MNCIFAAHIEYRNISIQKNCQPVQNPLTLYYPHAYPPPILSHPCMPSPYSIPPHAYPPPYSIPAHAYLPPYSIPPHAYPALYSIPAHAYLPPYSISSILSHLIHTLPLWGIFVITGFRLQSLAGGAPSRSQQMRFVVPVNNTKIGYEPILI